MNSIPTVSSVLTDTFTIRTTSIFITVKPITSVKFVRRTTKRFLVKEQTYLNLKSIEILKIYVSITLKNISYAIGRCVNYLYLKMELL